MFIVKSYALDFFPHHSVPCFYLFGSGVKCQVQKVFKVIHGKCIKCII